MCLVILFGGFLLQQAPLPRNRRRGAAPGAGGGQEEGSGSRDPYKPAPAAPQRLSLEGRKHRDLGL